MSEKPSELGYRNEHVEPCRSCFAPIVFRWREESGESFVCRECVNENEDESLEPSSLQHTRTCAAPHNRT